MTEPFLRNTVLPLALSIAAMAGAKAAAPEQHGHAMHEQDGGMVMNANPSTLPRDCTAIAGDYTFEVQAGVEHAEDHPGLVFGYSQNEFRVRPCSRVTVRFVNRDRVRHQWMVHGLPRYLYPGGMFHIEAAGSATLEGSFIVPSDHATYLVHCDLAQHMEKGMKAQLVVGAGSGDLWAVPGVSSGAAQGDYLSPALAGLAGGAAAGLFGMVMLLWPRLRRPAG